MHGLVPEEGLDCSGQHIRRGWFKVTFPLWLNLFVYLFIHPLYLLVPEFRVTVVSWCISRLSLDEGFSCVCYSAASVFLCSCCSTVWQISSVFGACNPARLLAGRSLPLLGDLMAKVCPNFSPLFLLISHHVVVVNECFVSIYPPVLAFSLEDTKLVVLCGVEKAEVLHVFPVQNSITCMHWMEVAEDCRFVRYSYQYTSCVRIFFYRWHSIILKSLCASVPLDPSAAQMMNLNFSSPSYQPFQRGTITK